MTVVSRQLSVVGKIMSEIHGRYFFLATGKCLADHCLNVKAVTLSLSHFAGEGKELEK
jgi:hypothetical protein